MSMPRVGPRPGATAVNPRGRQLIIAAVVFIVIIGLINLFRPHENRYEKLARDVTVALQNNDLDAVKKYQNAETATMINRGIVGRAADRLAPLGKIKRVKETTPSGAADQVHEFDVTFDKGSIHETLKVDPDFKIVHFHYTAMQGSS
jgi:hypothetical protein